MKPLIRTFLSHDGILATAEPFSRIFLSHGGISAITEPFHEFLFHTMESRLSRSLFTIFSFTWWNLGYHGAFSRIFLSHNGIPAITSLFTNFSFTRWNPGYHGAFSRIFFHMMESTKCTIWGKTLFIYITEYLHRIRLVKNLAF
jgi:hypothetical protein